jgi:PBP1b-binding outer membrane lipoprotein LpoB
MPEFCSPKTQHMGVSRTSQLLDALIPQIYPTYVRQVTQGPPDPATGQPATCVRYEDPANEIGHVVGVTTEQDCVENGTSLIYSSYRV